MHWHFFLMGEYKYVERQSIYQFATALVMVFLGACSSTPDELLEVRQFHMRKTKPADIKKAQMVRGEQMYWLKGAVSMNERRKRLGDYYTVAWRAGESQPTHVVMDYQQASTGVRVKRMSSDLPFGVSEGKLEFKVTGDSYNNGGRVLVWRIRLLQGDKVLAEKRSYLWR